MQFQVHALPFDAFQPLMALTDAELAARNVRRVRADGRPAYPCRVSLQDADEGECLLLLSYEHHRVATPYRASGAIYVREAAQRARPPVNDIPALLRRRVLSLRAYDADGMMVSAEVVAGTDAEAGIARLFANARTEYLHVHYAQPGCYACRIERA
jgi:hypothetical protein